MDGEFPMDGDEIEKIISSTKPDISKLPGGWEPEISLIPNLDDIPLNLRWWELIHGISGMFVYNVLSKNDCLKLIGLMNLSPNIESVSIQGRKDTLDYRTGSVRTTLWTPSLARQLWNKINHCLNKRRMNTSSSTDWWQGNKERKIWEPVGLTPLLRFMQYKNQGQHYAHYDAGFIYPDDNYRTLQSVVIYLTTCDPQDGGATRIISDNQEMLPIWDRQHQDWTRETRPEEILFKSHPIQGNIFIFDHRICHDVEMYTGNNPRIIIRTDILFRAIYV